MPDYQVTVVTGAVRSAGTDASVYLAMHGSMASTGEVLLDNEGRNDFEAGSSDTFTVSADELGRIERITIRHDDKGFASGWFLEFVAIRNEDTGEEWIFPCGRWLDRREGDGKIKLDLTPTASSKTSAAIPAECRATGASSREEAIAWPTILPVVPRAAGNSIKVTLHKTNTPPTGENVSLSVGATLTGQQCAIIQYFAQQREAITSRVTTKRYSGQYGYTGSGNPAKDPVPTELQASTGVDPVHKAVWDEMRHEGSSSSINAYDSQVLTWGRGWGARTGLLPAVMTEFVKDRGARDRLIGGGVDFDAGKFRVVNTYNGGIEEGDNALYYMQLDPKVLTFLFDLGEDKTVSPTSTHPYAQLMADAQWEVLLQNAGKVPSYASSWDVNAIQLVVHLGHWGSSYGWSGINYSGTGGDVAEIVKKFARSKGGKKASGAYLYSNSAAADSGFQKWGEGVAASVLHKIDELPDDIDDAGADYSDYVFFKSESGYYVVPALPGP